MSITPFPTQGQYPWYDQLEQWGADTQSAAESATIAADQVHADVAGAVADAQAAQVAATNAAGLVGAPAGEAVKAAVSVGGVARETLDEGFLPLTVQKPLALPPLGFRGLSILPTPTIRKRRGVFEVDLDVESLKPTGGVTYYTSPTAWAGTDGLTPETPARITELLAKPDVGTIVLAAGEYFRTGNTVPDGIEQSINWIGEEGTILTGWENPSALAWTNTSGNIYQTTRTAVASIIDKDSLTGWGDFTVYDKKDTLEDITGEGQWAQVGPIVHVWCIGGTDLTVSENRQQIRLQLQTRNGIFAKNSVHYVENIDFYGCSYGNAAGIYAGENSTIVAKDCTVKYNSSNGFMTGDGGNLITIDCESSSNSADGFNYHGTLGGGGEFIEINCKSHHNGLKNPGINNASSAHESYTGIRVNGDYYAAAGPVVADVNATHTWNLGCYAGGATGIGSVATNTSWLIASPMPAGGTLAMWLDECTSDTSDYAYHVSENADMYLHGCGFSNPNRTIGSSTPKWYTR